MAETEKKKAAPKTAKAKAVRKKPAPKKKAVEAVVEAKPKVEKPVHRTYLFAVGRRKTAIARVRLYPKGSGVVTVNGKTFEEYFPTLGLQLLVRQPMQLSGHANVDVSVKVIGGGVHSQAESVRHGIARVLLLADAGYRKVLKPAGLLTRDARVKERKKYGLKRARRAPQWQKR